MPGRPPHRRRPPRPPAASGDGPAVEATIESIAAGGEGVARLPDGRVVFVHRTAPGERVRLQVQAQHRQWARGRLLQVLQPSPERRDAPCPHYADCGGCTLEHLDYAAQLRAKARIAHDALTRIGGLRLPLPEIVASPREFQYRNRVSFALRRLGGGRVVAGFHALGEPERIVDIDGACRLPEPAIGAVWDRLRAAWGENAGRLPAGERLRLTLRATAAGEVTLLVEGGGTPGEPETLLGAVEGLSAVWHRPRAVAPPALLAGAAGLAEAWGDEELEVSGAAFLQVNRLAAELLAAHVLELAGSVAGARVVDAYCGVGLYARKLARQGAQVIGIELDALAVAEARRTAPPGARFEAGAVEALLPAALPADLVILNPPRAGVAPEIADALLRQPPHRLIYVSCNPATLARDLRRLQPALHIESVRCFDLFPQTAHVETVVSGVGLPASGFRLPASDNTRGSPAAGSRKPEASSPTPDP